MVNNASQRIFSLRVYDRIAIADVFKTILHGFITCKGYKNFQNLHDFHVFIKVTCRVKTDTTCITKNTTSSHNFSTKFKANTL